MNSLDVDYLAGRPVENAKPLPLFDGTVCAFLDDLSKELRKDERTGRYPDVAALAFFCRKANILRIKQNYAAGGMRIGRGLAFHIAPSNVPVNFAYTYLFGLASGNANVVKVPSAPFEQTDLICGAAARLFEREEYAPIAERTALIRYDRSEEEITRRLSELADLRVIWGGDETIRRIRSFPVPARCKEITFADRYSIALLDAAAVAAADGAELGRLARRFYNDTYLMDQNACSTPHMVFWRTRDGALCRAAQERFWQAVYDAAAGYALTEAKAGDKYVMLCRYAMDLDRIHIRKWGNRLYVITPEELPEDITGLRGKCGLFFQHAVGSLEEIAPRISRTVQSCMVYGVDPEEVRDLVFTHHLAGIDRVVPVGKALDIGFVWDGYDLPVEMSRAVAGS